MREREIMYRAMLYSINKEGAVINDAHLDRVQEQYRPILEEIGDYYRKEFGDSLLSIYVRGSVSVGRAKPFISDIDSVAIVSTDISPKKQKEIYKYSKKLQEKYPFVTLVDMTVISPKTLLEDKEFSNLKIYLKTQSVCLYGKDIVKEIKDVKPGRELALEMYGDLSEKLQELEKIFSQDTTEKTYLGEKRSTEFWCIWTMRTILRSGLGLVMLKKSVYSQDLQTCADIFLAEYPEYKQYMEKAISWAMNPTANRKEIKDYLKEFSPKYIALWDKALNN